MLTVLVIDDNPAIGSALSTLLGLHDITCTIALTPQAGMQMLAEDPSIAVVIQDMNFSSDTTSGEEGKRLFIALREYRPDLPIILLTAWTELESAVQLIKQGAADYIGKPWDDQKLITTILNLLELSELQQAQLKQSKKLRDARENIKQKADLCGLIYQSSEMQYLIELAIKIAVANVPVLITGPNGAGKEKIAEIVQANSRVKDGPFIKVNVGALPNELMEAELFGAEAGAYTGINKKRIGRFEAADGGTLFLDEIANLSANGQAKLLRILQTGEFERLGSSETKKCQVRIISATNANIQQAIAAGQFREDLYYRLNVIELKLPSLSERREDILPLIQQFLKTQATLDSHTVKQLQTYSWPGNVRELQNACQRAVLLASGGPLGFEHFGLPGPPPFEKNTSINIEPNKDTIIQALRENHGVVAQAARQLGLSRQALYRRMEKYSIKSD